MSQMVQSCKVCNLLKLDTHWRMNIIRNIYKIVSKLHLKNDQENILMVANEIKIKFVLKIEFMFILFHENNFERSVNQKISQHCLK